MAKLTLTTLATLRTDAGLISVNSNFDDIEEAIENTLSRDGTSPNTMGASLDMDSNRILNLPAPVSQSEPARLADLQDISLVLEGSVEDAVEDALDTILPSGTIVGTSDTQVLTNKTIDGDLNTVQDLPYSAIKSTSRSGLDVKIITGTAGTSGNLASWNVDGDLVDGGSAPASIVTASSTTTFTNKTIDANGTGNAISNIETADLATASKTGADAKVVTGTAGATTTLGTWNVDGDLVDTTLLGLTTLTDPNADRIAFWDDSAGSFAWLAPIDSTIISTTNLQLASGTYTPTSSSLSNVDAATPTVTHYLRVGNSVTVAGSITIDATAGGLASFEITLPIASNLAATSDLGGVASQIGESARILGSVANDTAVFSWTAVSTASLVWTFTFTYRVL